MIIRKSESRPEGVIGKKVLKKDAYGKVTGHAKFAADYEMENMVYGRVLRSGIPSAKIINIDTSKAEALEGVVCVLTAKDIPGRNGVGIIKKDQPVLVTDEIKSAGDALALVVAEDKFIAADALELIEVELEEMEPITDPFEAMKPGTRVIHGTSNILEEKILNKGDVDEALKNCDVIIENNYQTQMVSHMFIEPEAAIAYYEDGMLNLIVSTQNTHFDRGEISAVMDMPMNRINVQQAVTGGGFGGKLDISTQCFISLMAYYTKRPVQMIYDRVESTCASSNRHPYYIRYKTGATKDGKIQVVDVDLVADTGAYASYGPGVIVRGIVHMTGPYEVPNVRIDAKLVHTNNPMAGAMRGFGVPQVAVAHESQIELVAEELGISPWEIRKINALRPGDTTATRQRLDASVGILETLEAAEEKAREVYGARGELK